LKTQSDLSKTFPGDIEPIKSRNLQITHGTFVFI